VDLRYRTRWLQRECSCTFDAVQRFSIIAVDNQLGTTGTSALGNRLGTTVGVLYVHKQSVFAVDDAYATIKRADNATRHSVLARVAFRSEPTTQHDSRFFCECALMQRLTWQATIKRASTKALRSVLVPAMERCCSVSLGSCNAKWIQHIARRHTQQSA
jgi:hypothetical protein